MKGRKTTSFDSRKAGNTPLASTRLAPFDPNSLSSNKAAGPKFTEVRGNNRPSNYTSNIIDVRRDLLYAFVHNCLLDVQTN